MSNGEPSKGHLASDGNTYNTGVADNLSGNYNFIVRVGILKKRGTSYLFSPFLPCSAGVFHDKLSNNEDLQVREI